MIVLPTSEAANAVAGGQHTDAQVGVDAGIASSSCKILVLTVWDVKMGLRVTVFLCKTKVDDIDLISTLANPHEEVVGLDVTVDEGFGVDVLNA